MTDKDQQYEVAAILEHQGTSAKTLKYTEKLFGYPGPDWQPLANLKGGCRDSLQDYHRKMGLLVYRWMSNGCATAFWRLIERFTHWRRDCQGF